MTKDETIKIMAMLGAFYSGGKNDPKAQAQAWHLILGKYDFHMTEQAVLHFAENDTRDYATFPTVGKIVAEIKNVELRIERPVNEITRGIAYGTKYELLSKEAKRLIPEASYNEWLEMDAERFNEVSQQLAEALRSRHQKLLENNNGQNQ